MPPTPETITVWPGPDVGGVHRRAPAGGHAAADQHGLVERQVVVDLDRGVLVDDAVLAEGAEHAHRAVLPARAGDREALAGQVALEDGRAHVADRLLAARAVAAGAAVRDERADDVVADLDPRDARADLLDDPGALVAEHHRQPGLEVAVRDVHVGVAQAGVRVADQHLALPGPVEVELLDLDRLAGLVHDCCLWSSWVLLGRCGSAVLRVAGERPATVRSVKPARRSVGAPLPGHGQVGRLPRSSRVHQPRVAWSASERRRRDVDRGTGSPDRAAARSRPAGRRLPAAAPLAKFHAPEVVFGLGSLGEAGFAAARLGARRPLVVTDPGIIEAGWCDELLGHLRDVPARARSCGRRSRPNPKDHEVHAAYERYVEQGCDVHRRARRRLLHRRREGGRDPVRQRRPDPRLRRRRPGRASRSRRC